jgi:hypothetical protein
MSFRGRLDAETASTLDALLGPLAKPHQTDGVPDLRTPEQRLGDGVAAIIHLAANAGDAPVRGGVKPHLPISTILCCCAAATIDWYTTATGRFG